MTNIHPTAMVSDGARIADDVEIGPYSLIGPHVSLGRGGKIASHVVIEGHTAAGRRP